jgi:hypothetical protein
MPRFEEPPFDEFVDDIEISISDALDSLSRDDVAKLYAEILDAEQRLDALRDALTVLASDRPA